MNSNKRPRLEYEGDSGSSADHRASAHTTAPKAQLTRACAECKKHKIKCFTQSGQTACNKCLRSGIHCVPHNFAQKFIDDDTAWKSQAVTSIDQLKAAVEHLLQRSDLPDLSHYEGASSTQFRALGPSEVPIQTVSPSTTTHSGTGSTRGNFTAEGPSADHQEDDSDLVPLPMNNLYNMTDPGNSRLIRVDPALVNGPDFISQGVVSVAEAEFLFNHYRTRINSLLWDGILCAHKTLQDARQSSPLLVATVLTVAALHIPNREKSLRATYDAFVSLMRASCLLRSRNLDDVRGLCIGAFYLTSLSWALCTRAVRVATEMNLHKSSLQFARGSLNAYERVQLWYVLYVCDHQFALAYGRPPMMHDDAAIRNADKFLSSGLSCKGDRGLVAQVKLFRILAGAYFMYGCDPDLELGGQDFEMLQSFNISLDQWRLEHQQKAQELVGPRESSLNPNKATTLYYHLARFQLNSLSLRGISGEKPSSGGFSGSQMSWDRQEAANNAIGAAMSTVRLLVEDSDLRKAQIEMPIFVHAMIAVCASFLLKMAVVFSELGTTSGNVIHLPRDLSKYGLNFHTKNALSNVQTLVSVLSPVADNASQQHVARQVVTGLRELLQRFSPGHEEDSYVYLRSGNPEPPSSLTIHNMQHPQTATLGSRGDMVLPAAEHASMLHNSNNLVEALGHQRMSSEAVAQPFEQQQDPFDLLGDLDWRFNDAFLWGINVEVSQSCNSTL
ncbi:hypothetical protein BX600DRAFT_513450 [Xylariales sp. PMI_506]|nr:hypothetical protein BX600DRAFT_513450 [Xylariales sp. PMI_506]